MSTTPVGPPSPRPLSAGLLAGPFLFVSGQVPVDLQTGRVSGQDIEEQTRRALGNLAGVLAAAGLALGDVVKTTVFLTDIKDFNAMNEVYRELFSPPFPTRSTVQVAALAAPEMRVEIEAIALRRDQPARVEGESGGNREG